MCSASASSDASASSNGRSCKFEHLGSCQSCVLSVSSLGVLSVSVSCPSPVSLVSYVAPRMSCQSRVLSVSRLVSISCCLAGLISRPLDVLSNSRLINLASCQSHVSSNSLASVLCLVCGIVSHASHIRRLASHESRIWFHHQSCV